MRKIITLACCLLMGLSSWSQTINEYVVSPRLLDRFAEAPNSTQRILILFSDQVDILDLEQQLIAQRYSVAQRAQAINRALREHADATQPLLVNRLSEVSGVVPESITRFWVSNILFLDTDQAGLAAISQWPEIELIDWNAPLEKEETINEGPAPMVQPDGTEPGLLAIGADFMWEMGYTGYGQVAFTSDTGVDPDEPAIKSQWRGHVEDLQSSWYNNTGAAPLPYDCDDHGTHVTGTILGLDRFTNDTIGVAFNAQWVGAAILCGIGTEDNIEAFQWALDPDGNPDTVEDMPDAINNSWRDPGIGNDCNNVYIPILNALEAAGVAVVFSAGNEGPGSTTITPPKYLNTDLVNTFAVGALNGSSTSLTIADFSSRGPSICGGDSSLLIKPEVSAPGVSVRSCVPGGYSFFSGTSMACPHTVGALLLLKEAFPYLSGTDLKLALYFSAIDLGEPGEDNVYGMGIINLENAFNYLLAEGYVPVSPQVNHDANLFCVRAAELQCQEGVYLRVWVENGGQNDLNALDITVSVGTETIVQNWTGNLSTGERTSVEIGPILVNPGQYEVEARLDQPNGQLDQRPLNDQKRTRIEVIDREPISLYQSGDGAAPCENGGVVLYADYPGAGTLEITWYDQLVNGNQVGTGNPLILENLSTGATYYAEGKYLEPIGMEGPEDGEIGTEEAGPLRGLVFDALVDFRIKSVWVDAASIGPRIIRIEQENGDVLTEKVLLINELGLQEVALNLFVPQGDNYEIMIESGMPFAYNTDGADYPYSIKDVVRIKQANYPFNGNAFNHYYYFYQWTVEYTELCGRAPITVTVNTGNSVATAAFSTSLDTLDLGAGTAELSVTNNSTGATSYYWDFGNGEHSTEEAPVVQYELAGNYTMTLTAFDADGCSSISTQQIVVLPAMVTSLREPSLGVVGEGLTLFPNPAKDQIQLIWESKTGQAVEIRLLDNQGRILKTWSKESLAPETQISLDLSEQIPGLYFIQVLQKGNSRIKRLILN